MSQECNGWGILRPKGLNQTLKRAELRVTMARIGIIGLGNWGTALAKVWCDDGHNVMGWTIEQEAVSYTHLTLPTMLWV